MRDLRRIDVLLNEVTKEEFHKGDIVKIYTSWGTNGTEIIGRIDYIETLQITIDVSKEYQSNRKQIKFEEIRSIEKYSDQSA